MDLIALSLLICMLGVVVTLQVLELAYDIDIMELL